MAEWTTKELLCNSRGLDDGYLYIHVEHAIAERLREITQKKGKRSLGDPARWGGFSGSLQAPLSNEQIDLEESVKPPKSSAGNRQTIGELTSPLEKNMCLCAAFTEPLKLPHKSMMLIGATPPPPTLRGTDFAVRRPRLNYGAATIANLGGSSLTGRSAGHGSARSGQHSAQIGRQVVPTAGHPLFQPRSSLTAQPTTVTWQQMPQYGMPAPPREFIPHMPQYTFQRPNYQPYPPQYGSQSYQRGFNQNAHQQPHHIRFNQQAPVSGNQQQQVSTLFQQQRGGYNQRNLEFQQPPQPMQSFHRSGVPAMPQSGSQISGGQQPGYVFNRNGQQRQVQAQSQHQNKPTVNPNLMNSLRSQLASTLQQNRRRQDGGGR